MNPFRNHFVLTAALFVFLFLLAPLRATFELDAGWTQVALLGVVLSAVFPLSRPGRLRRVAILLALTVPVTGTVAALFPGPGLVAVELVSGIAFTLLMAWILLGNLLRAPRVTLDVLSGSIACYLLVALAFAMTFALCFHIDPESLSVPAWEHAGATGPFSGLRDPRMVTFAYFSFVTLTTLGYGDVLPLAPLTASLATLEAVIGQIYLTVLVAWLVGMHLAHRDLDDPADG